MDARQTSQTGRREIRISGSLQMRQSAGNNVVKRLSATSAAHETTAGLFRADVACIARVRSQLLLKTTSWSSEDSGSGACLGGNPFKYSGEESTHAMRWWSWGWMGVSFRVSPLSAARAEATIASGSKFMGSLRG